MPERTYCVGLPVIITVHDDGSVEYEVDLAEAGAAIRETYPVLDGGAFGEVPYPSDEAQVEVDATAVDDYHDRSVQ